MTWITLKSGRRFDLENPTPDMFTIEDIAEGLAKECRYNGQCIDHYSVAQHSVHGAHMIAPKFALEFLFHDGEEFVWRDMNSPAKQMLGSGLCTYREYASRTDMAIRAKLGLPMRHSPEVKEVDNRMYATERRDVAPYGDWEGMDLINADAARWPRYNAKPYENLKIIPWDWRHAREAFMRTFWMLTQ
jgi:hypothetical protein